MAGLPTWLSTALQDRLDHVSRSDLRDRAQAISDRYRAGGTSGIVSSESDALAYAVVRMPATYAAVRAALSYAIDLIPGFAPQSLLDVGAGPGTATWAAIDAWPSLQSATLADSNPYLLALGRGLRDAAPDLDAAFSAGDLARTLDDTKTADVVLASYVLGEIAAPDDILGKLWRATDKLLVLVEPGTPAGTARILRCRGTLLAAGARIVAPCSHDGVCPLSTGERWCHFSTRLPRSRDHLVTKGVSVPYEDEKFAYLIAGKGFAGVGRGRRILATPKVSKAGVALTLCAPDRVEERIIPHRQKDAYRTAKRLDWGDAIDD
jgi:ribosomal protein RSM22 (predicted rRNA methylase)